MSLPPHVKIGTSSWTHEFWKGQIYHREYKSKKDFNLNSLSEYADLGLFNTVEIDSTFYTPPKAEILASYARVVPEGFSFTAKLWERLTTPIFPNNKRYGKDAGQHNPDFLNPEVFREKFLPPFQEDSFKNKFAFFLLQFSPMDSSFALSAAFKEKLEKFLAAMPEGIRLSIEIRNRELLGPEYIQFLNRYSVCHCFNYWTAMPPLIEQMKIIAKAGGLAAPFYFARLLTPLNVSFESARKLFEPFDKIRQRQEQARSDVLRIVERARQRNIPAYIIVNNRFEGNSPETVREICELIS